MHPQPGRRIAVVGNSGSGKTYVAQALAERLGVPYICNDAIIHRANWRPPPRDERLREFQAAFAQPAWTFDGNFGSLKDPEDRLALERIDTLVWLDLPRWRAHSQLLVRTVRRAWTKQPLWHGNRESWRQSFASRESILLWALRAHGLRRRQYAALVADPHAAHVRWSGCGRAARWIGGWRRWRGERRRAEPRTEPERPRRPGPGGRDE